MSSKESEVWRNLSCISRLKTWTAALQKKGGRFVLPKAFLHDAVIAGEYQDKDARTSSNRVCHLEKSILGT